MSEDPTKKGIRRHGAKFTALIGLDRRVITGILPRILPMFFGPVGAFIIVHFLSVERQGIYYLFGSLIALRSLFELGVTAAISQIAAHARNPADEADPGNRRLPASFVVVVNRWMNRAALLYGVVAGVGGLVFLLCMGQGPPDVLVAWTLAIVVAAFQLSQEGRMGVLYGIDKVEEANTLRFRLGILQYVSQWIMLFAGLGLLSFSLSSLASYLCEIFYFRRHHRWLWADGDLADVGEVDRFGGELKTLMRRVSQTYMTGYFVMQIQIPISFYLFGALGSAQYGFTQTVGNSLIGLAGVWISVAFPAIAYSISQDQIEAAKAQFLRRGRQALAVGVVGVIGTLFAYWVLGHFGRFADRLMPPLEATVLFISMFLQQVALSLLFWPRAYKVEPFVHVAYIQMVITPLLLLVLGHFMGLLGFSLANVVSWVAGLALIIPVVMKFWNRRLYTGLATPANPAN